MYNIVGTASRVRRSCATVLFRIMWNKGAPRYRKRGPKSDTGLSSKIGHLETGGTYSSTVHTYRNPTASPIVSDAESNPPPLSNTAVSAYRERSFHSTSTACPAWTQCNNAYFSDNQIKLYMKMKEATLEPAAGGGQGAGNKQCTNKDEEE